MSTVATRRAPNPLRALGTGVLLGCAAIVVAALVSVIGSERLAHDFRAAYLPAAEAVRDGESPYPAPGDPALEQETAYVYPPALALALVPLTGLSVDVAGAVAFLGALAALLGALAIVGVRDARCYAVALLWAPAFNALEMANVSALLVLAVAVAWRFRHTTGPLATTLGLAIAIKPLFWPLLAWPAARRLRTAALAGGVALSVTFATWAAIGFDGLLDYPDLVSQVSELESGRSYSVEGMAAALDLPAGFGRLLALVSGGALLVACVVLGRRGDDRRAFTCALASSLALTPVLWQHYLALLAVPLALARPRLSAAWFLPLALWASPRDGHGDALQPFLPALVAIVLLAVLLHPPAKASSVAEQPT